MPSHAQLPLTIVRKTRLIKSAPKEGSTLSCSKRRFLEREVKGQLTTLPADLRAEIEKRLPEVSKSIGVPIQDLRMMIAGMAGSTVDEGGTENLTPEEEAEFLIHFSLQMLQQFTGLDV
jgi:hypothetical protein